MLRSLFSILRRFGITLLFFALEGACFLLIVRFNTTQNAIFLSSANRITGYLNDQTERLTDFWVAAEEVEKLREANVELEQQLKKYKADTRTSLDSVRNDSARQLYTLFGAKIINNSINRTNNYLVLNKGARDSIREDMGVITDKGVIGIVVGTTKRYSLVMSLLHQQTRISAKIKQNDYFGPLVWRGLNPTSMRLEDIPKHADLNKQDTIVTSGYSTMFPADVLIGTIDTFWIESGSNFYTIDVKLAEDLAKLEYAYVVRHLHSEELQELQQQIEDE